jgi:hypothetical protein
MCYIGVVAGMGNSNVMYYKGPLQIWMVFFMIQQEPKIIDLEPFLNWLMDQLVKFVDLFTTRRNGEKGKWQ